MNIVETPSKKDQVRNYLIQELNSGKYPPGSLFLSENVLFRELGICKNTVREALSSLVSDGLLERVRGKGTFVLEPRPNLAGKHFRGGGSLHLRQSLSNRGRRSFHQRTCAGTARGA